MTGGFETFPYHDLNQHHHYPQQQKEQKLETLLLYCCSFFSSFCCLLLLITASGLLMLRVKDVSGSSGEFKNKHQHQQSHHKQYLWRGILMFVCDDRLVPLFNQLCVAKVFFAYNLQCLRVQFKLN